MTPKDVVFLGPSEHVYMIARFGPHKGDYMFHCHNLIHEDDDMLRAFRVNGTGMNSNNQASAQPFINNALHKFVYNNWAYADPMLGETAARNTALVPVHNKTLTDYIINVKRLYKIFYPLPSDFSAQTSAGYTNPWMSDWCPLEKALEDEVSLGKELDIL
jgi:hypothetical protein